MSKFLYRLWIPQVGIHGSDYNKICEKCQDKIEETIENGFVLPTTVQIDTSMGLSLTFGFHYGSIELCQDCAKNFKTWLDSQEYLHFNNKQIELWRNTKEEEA
jgi:hypothetical protein